MQSSTLTSKGQITIPNQIRRKLGLHVGDKVGFTIEDNRVVLFRKKSNIEAAFGLHRAHCSVTLTEIDQVIRKRGARDRG